MGKTAGVRPGTCFFVFAPLFVSESRDIQCNSTVAFQSFPAGGLPPAGRLVTIASASPGGDCKFFQVKACGCCKNRDGCVVRKEAEGRFLKIHELEFRQQEHFVAKVPAGESGYSVKETKFIAKTMTEKNAGMNMMKTETVSWKQLL